MKFKPFKKILKSVNVGNDGVLLKDNFKQIKIINDKYASFVDGSYVILDFGEETSGGVRLLIQGMTPNGKIRLRFGESVGEVNAEIGEHNATNDHSPRDFYIVTSGISDVTYGHTGFRFLRLDFIGDAMNLASICCALDVDDRRTIGKFECNDELLNEIYKTSEHTLRLNLHNGVVWDGVKRDRLCWVGDSYIELLALTCLYDKTDEYENVLEFTKDEVLSYIQSNQYVNSMVPSTYALWWVMVLIKKYQHDLNESYFLDKLPLVKEIVSTIEKCVTKDGKVIYPFNFIDWPTHGVTDNEEDNKISKHDEDVGTIALTYLTLSSLKETLSELGESSLNEEIDGIQKKLSNSKLTAKRFLSVASLIELAGLSSEDNLQFIKDNGAEKYSTFYSYFILSAKAKLGLYQDALDDLRKYYGGMLSLGATSFFEDFDLAWLENALKLDELPNGNKIDFHATYGRFCYLGYRHSLCHGWSVGPIPYIVEHVVGLKKIDAVTYKLDPHLGDLEYVNFSYPTEYGPIVIKIEKDGVKKIETPEEIKIILERN